ncbi:MAG: helix-turn-helix domain containing protein [Roseovarius sp.]|nr:helix-turn-helix domain containing protein [Roseovarius sp.]
MDTRTALLSLAERMMRQRGYDAVSFGDLANDIGIKTASVHYHFAKKTDLAVELLQAYATKLSRLRANISANAANGGAAIKSLVALYRAALDDGQQLCLSVSLSAGRDSLDEPARDVLNEILDDTLDWLAATFERAKSDGSMLGVTSAQDEAVACLALLEGAQLLARAAGALGPYDAATRGFIARIR